MTKDQAIAKWTQAAGAEKAGNTYIRAGNWEPTSFALRHCTGTGQEVEQLADNVLRVTVALPPDAPEGKKPRPPFILVVA